MDNHNAVEIRNISKSFKIHTRETDKKTNSLNKTHTKTIINSVIDDVSLDIKKGDIIGIIGRNGAGKSTFLALISKIMQPDSGTIQYSGKMATILELGMGFHPDMTGRENIYLKGKLYGFSQKQIDERVEEIINYSGIRTYIDNPVRTYSSGMSSRLAFSIMIHVDSDIMLVDEVLSVGDASFSSKAREHFIKMAKTGKTIIIVSHNIDYLESLCNRIVWLENGKIIRDGFPKTICSEYLNSINNSLEIISDLANAGVAEYQYKLARLFHEGRLVDKNDEQYNYYLQQAAIQGHVRSQVEYADLLLSQGSKSDAMNYYTSAANKGDSEAKIKLSSMNKHSSNDGELLSLVFEDMSSKNNPVLSFRYASFLLKTAWTENDRQKAFVAFKKSADLGFPQSIHQVALLFKDGIGTTRDVNKMKEYLLKASDYGHIPSMTTLADLLLQGRIIPKDESLAFNLILKASHLGDSNSMYRLGVMYRDGIGTSTNIEESEKWFSNYSKSVNNLFRLWAFDYLKLGISNIDISTKTLIESAIDSSNPTLLYNYYNNVIYDESESDNTIHVFDHYIENSHADVLKHMGNYYYSGIGINKDYTKAFNYYMKSAELGDPWSINRIGEMYRDGVGTVVDYDQALHYFKQASELGNLFALSNIIAMYSAGLIQNRQSFDYALNTLINVSRSGNSDASRRVANLYYEGTGVAKNYSKALYYYRKAALLGDQWSKNRLAEMYRDGKGTPIDYSQSSYWFNK